MAIKASDTPNASIASKTGTMGITRVGPTKGTRYGTNTHAKGDVQTPSDNRAM